MSSTEGRSNARPSRKTVAEAAAWITRLHSSRRSPEVEAGFRDWLADEERARAFEDMTEIWEAIPAVPAAEMPRMAHGTFLSRTTSLARAAVLLVAIAAASFVSYVLLRDPSYATEIGEQRVVNLDEGTRVSLNSGTRMAVQFDERERRIVLRGGEAFFEVAHDATRPFVVVAGDHQVTALGTSFGVRLDSDHTEVTLVDGKVAIRPQGNTSSSPLVLTPGERLTFVKGSAPKLDMPSIEAVTAWRRGQLILDETLLADAVAEMNRYDKTMLIIDDPAIAALPVSGIYRTGDSPGFARIVARMYGIALVEEGDRIHLHERAEQSSH